MLVMKMDIVLVERAVFGGSLVNGGTGCRNMIGWLVTRGNYQGEKKCLRKRETEKQTKIKTKIWMQV